LDVNFLYLGLALIIIGIVYNLQTWRFPDKDYTPKQQRTAKGDSIFMVSLGIVLIALAFLGVLG
jgi:uncharacterized membrane protein